MTITRLVLTVAFLVFGIASLITSFVHVVSEMERPGDEVEDTCGRLIRVESEAVNGCAAIRQAEATAALAAGVGGATWMIAAVATATAFRSDKKAAPQQPVPQAPAGGPYPPQR